MPSEAWQAWAQPSRQDSWWVQLQQGYNHTHMSTTYNHTQPDINPLTSALSGLELWSRIRHGDARGRHLQHHGTFNCLNSNIAHGAALSALANLVYSNTTALKEPFSMLHHAAQYGCGPPAASAPQHVPSMLCSPWRTWAPDLALPYALVKQQGCLCVFAVPAR